MSYLNDDVVYCILTKVANKEDRKSFSEVCKQWLEVEGLTRSSLSLHITRPNFSLGNAVTRFSNVVNLVVSGYFTSDTHLELIAQTFPKVLQSIMIKTGHDLGPKGLLALGNGCPKLSQVEFGEQAVEDSGAMALLHSARNLQALVLLRNRWISNETLIEIGSSSISSLKLFRCSQITDVGLRFLANGSTSKTLKELVLYECVRVSDTGVGLLRRMCSLEYLYLSGRWSIFTEGCVAISAIHSLKELHMVYVQHVTDTTVVALAKNCRNLEILELSGCTNVTGAGIRAFSGHKCLKQLLLFYLNVANFNPADVETIALGCPSLEAGSVLVNSGWSLDPSWSSNLIQNNTSYQVRLRSINTTLWSDASRRHRTLYQLYALLHGWSGDYYNLKFLLIQ